MRAWAKDTAKCWKVDGTHAPASGGGIDKSQIYCIMIVAIDCQRPHVSVHLWIVVYHADPASTVVANQQGNVNEVSACRNLPFPCCLRFLVSCNRHTTATKALVVHTVLLLFMLRLLILLQFIQHETQAAIYCLCCVVWYFVRCVSGGLGTGRSNTPEGTEKYGPLGCLAIPSNPQPTEQANP